MDARNILKKMVGEPLVWIAMSMVGVIVMGPAAADLARTVVGGDASRGDVDHHGETIVKSDPVQPSSTQITDTTTGDSTTHRIAMQDEPKPRATPSQTAFAEARPGNRGTDHGETQTIDEIQAETKTSQLETERHRPQDDQADPLTEAGRKSDELSQPQGTNESKAGNNKHTLLTRQPFSNKPATSEPNVVQDHLLELSQADNKSDSDSADVSMADLLPESTELKPLPPDAPDEAITITNASLWDENASSSPPELNKADASDAQWGGSVVTEETGKSPQLRDETLNFNPDADASNAIGSDEPMNRLPHHEQGSSSVPVESGETWWDTMVTGQFWPDRHAHFADLDSVVFIALQHSAQVQILNDQPRIEATYVRQREADFDWSAFVDANWNSIDEPIRSELQTGSTTGRYVQEELFVGSGLRKRLTRGGQLQVGSTIGTLDNNSVFLAPPDQGTATFSLDYRQPLLRGRGREVTQSQIILARLNVEASEHSAKQAMQQYLADVVAAYWTLYRARGILAQRHRNASRAREVLRRLTDNFSEKSVSGQLFRARAAASARQSEVIDAEYAVADAQEQLMNLTHGESVADANSIEIIPTDAPPQVCPPHDLRSVTELAISNRPEVKRVLAEIKAATVQQVIALDGLKPQLDAIISSYVAGVRGNKDVGNAIYDQFSAGDPSYSVGMSFEIPVGRRSANAGFQRQEIQRRLLQNKLRQTLSDVTVSARSAFRDVYRLTAIVENNRRVMVQSAQDVNVIEQQSSWLSKEGNSAALHLNNLLLAQDRLAAAEQNLLDSQSQLAIAYVTLKRSTGELLRDETVICNEVECQACDAAHLDNGQVVQATYQETIEPRKADVPRGLLNRLKRKLSTSDSTVVR